MRVSNRVLALLWCVCAPALADFVPACEQGPTRGKQNIEIWPQELPAPDYLDVIKQCLSTSLYYTFQQPESVWLDAERAAFKSALAKQPVDVLIAPFQVQGYGLERTERAVMSADLAYQLGGAVRVADPFLVARALGEGERRYERNDIIDLARAVGARTAVIGYVGHDRAHRMTITIETVTLDATTPGAGAVRAVKKDWRAVPFTDAEPPFAVFHKMLPSIVADIGLPVVKRSGSLQPVRLPKATSFSLAELAAEKDAIPASAGLVLLGAMTGSVDELSRERLFERALVTSWHFDAAAGDTTFVRAYALTGLEHRPAALALLEGAVRPEAVVLRALLNGNVYEAAATLPSVENPLARLLLAVQVDDLRIVYGDEKLPQAAHAEAFGPGVTDWTPLVEGRAEDLDPWAAEDPAVLKYLLDTVFHVDGLSVESVIGGSFVVGKPADDVTISLATVRHVARFVASAPVPVCCTEPNARPTIWDLVALIEGRNVSRIVKSLDRTVAMQALPEKAGAELVRYLQIFDGHPLIAAANMDYALAMTRETGDAAVQSWQRQSNENATVVVYSASGQSRLAVRALAVLGYSGPDAATLLDAYGYDYPRRPFWPEQMFRTHSPADVSVGIDALRREAAAYTRWDTTPFNMLAAAGEFSPERDSLVAELKGRFVGTPSQKFLLARLQPSSPATTDPIESARALLAEDPDNWAAREALGSLIVERGGRYEEAYELFLAHPPFRQQLPPNRIRLSNEAYDAGNFFFWNGREQLAIPFFEISVGLGTGSEGSVTSEIRLDLVAGRYREAAAKSLARAGRYPSAYAYRDYLSFLHAFGYGEEAWSGFSQLAGSFEVGQVWLAALVGQRREGWSEAQIREWLKRPGIRDAKFRGGRFALRYAVLVNASDHQPPRDLGALVEELEGEPAAWVDGQGSLARPHPLAPTGLELVSRSTFAAGTPRDPEGTRVKSEYAHFGAAYAAIRHGELDAAILELKAMAAHYPIENDGYSYALPYLAWAAAKTGDTIEFERYVRIRGDTVPRFDSLLARAFFAGVKQRDPVRARELLVSALPGHPYTENRPVLIEYQYAEACEWLFKETGDNAFVDVLLAWVESQQAITPTHAWPYAMEYTYARTPERRIRALAMTLYLDPTSERIASATRKEREEAEAWGKQHNPFLQDGDVTADGSVASVARAVPTDAG